MQKGLDKSDNYIQLKDELKNKARIDLNLNKLKLNSSQIQINLNLIKLKTNLKIEGRNYCFLASKSYLD